MPESVLLPPGHTRADGLYPGGWWSRQPEDGRILCELCPRECSLKDGDRGFCFVRQNVGGEMILTTYGKSTGFCIDPIEKKPLNHFLPGTSVLSFGTAGCNLGCKFCQNWSISKSREIEKLSENATPESIAAAAVATGCRSVAFTYNDPVIWAEYAMDTAAACHDRDVKTVAVTAAYITPQARGPFFSCFDAANVDLKAFTELFYKHLTLSHLEPVLETLRWLKHESDIWFEITNLVIPDENDSPDEFRQMCDWVLENVGDDVPVHFTAFHPDFRMQDTPRTPPETLTTARQIALDAGIRHAYVGNVNDVERQSTYCPGCEKLLVERDWHQLGAYNLNGNCCGFCGEKIAGVFEARPGNWGRRRERVDMSRFQSEASSPDAAFNQIDDVFSSGPIQLEASADSVDCSAQPELTEAQRAAIPAAVAGIVAAATCDQPVELSESDLAGAAGIVLSGAFVSLKRNGQLRSCCGQQGQPVRLDEALRNAAVRTARHDHRFPRISPTELDRLDLEVWLLYAPGEVTAAGADRESAVTIGRHGLQVVRGESRGLLLPGVATDNGWDAKTFLDQVCVKAGLPSDAWRDNETRLFTFEGDCLADQPWADTGQFPSRPAPCTVDEAARSATACCQNIEALLTGGTPNIYLPGIPDGEVQGLLLSVTWMGNATPIAQGRLALKNSMPLQSTLFQLTETVAGRLRNLISGRQLPGLSADLLVLYDAAMHGTVADVDVVGLDRGHRAVLVSQQSQFAMVFDREASPTETLEESVRQGEITRPEASPVYSLAAVSTAPRMMMKSVPQATRGPRLRPPGVAGRFYPANADELETLVDQCFESADDGEPQAWPAAMVPHAGLVFSGRIAAATLSRIAIPATVIVIGPKHTREGVEWAVAPHDTWSLPGGDIAADAELATRLAEAIPGLELDANAHRQEHAIEVELPLLRRLAPDSRVTGIAIGGGDLDRCRDFAEHLAAVVATLNPRPLLLISSDMNHFADDAENRRLDELALAAMETLDPETLLSTVREHRISMCGVLPAVIVMETLSRLGGLSSCRRTGYATSGDTTGDNSRVVGYAGMLLE